MGTTPSLGFVGRVLVAEDNAVNQLVMEGLLGQLGLEHDIVPDGVTALESFNAEPAGTYGLVLMDLHMPLLDGFDTARMIRERESNIGQARVPIIAVSASELATSRARAKQSGMDGYLAKPVSRERLAAIIQRVMGAAPINGSEVAGQASNTPAVPFRADELLALGGPEMARRALDVFVTHSRSLLTRLGEALARGDAPKAAEASHSLKGSCLAIGADEMAGNAARIESRAREGKLEDLRETLASLESNFQGIQEAISQITAF